MSSSLCPLCGRRHSSPELDLGAYALRVCRHCDLGFVEPMPLAEMRAAVYTDEAYYELAEARLARIRRYAAQRLATLDLFVNPSQPRALLDVGCASGLFLEYAAQRGWQATGLEQSPRLAQAAQSRVPAASILTGILEETKFTPEYDVVCLWEVLEHNPEPLELLRAAGRGLRPGGILCLSTPNRRSWGAALLGSRFPMFSPPEHVLFFSPASLRYLVRAVGGEVLYWRCFGELLPDEAGRGLGKLFPRLLALGSGRGGNLGRILIPLVHPLLVSADRLGWGLEMEWYIRFARPPA